MIEIRMKNDFCKNNICNIVSIYRPWGCTIRNTYECTVGVLIDTLLYYIYIYATQTTTRSYIHV